MNPGNAEQTDQDAELKKNQEAAKAEADRLVEQIQQEMASEITAIQKEDNPDRKAELEKDFRDKFIQKLNLQNLAKEASEAADKTDKHDEYQEKAKEVKKTLLEADEVIKKTGSLTGKEAVDKVLTGLVDKIKSGELSDRDVVDIEKTIGKQLSEGVVLSSSGQQQSTFEKNLDELKQTNKAAWQKVVDDLKDNATAIGKTRSEVKEKFEPTPTNQEDIMKRLAEEGGFSRDGRGENSAAYAYDEQSLYERRFTKEQRDFIKKLYSPKDFADYIDFIVNGGSGKEGEERRHEIDIKKAEIREKIERHYTKRNIPIPGDINDHVEQIWHEEASQEISDKLMDIANHLYLKLQQERPDKFFDEITQEDFMRGIKTTQIAITSAIDNLYITLSKIENNPNHELYNKVNKNLLTRESEGDYYLDERGEKRYMRVDPLPRIKNIKLSEFAQFLNITLNHWTHGMEYFHNTRVMFNHPPGEKGFYSQLGGYAEHLKGTDIDELLLLPDGQVILQAYHLYDKMLEEEFASQDWRHRTNQFTNRLEEINTQLEQQVIDRLSLLYPNRSKEQLINAVNTAVGMARGMLLTEPEKSAFGDPIDPDGTGLFASYGTNDAGALTVFNPLHVNIRWQGEHMLPMFYFMPLSNEGKGTKGMWNHKQMWENAQMFMDSLKKGVRSEHLPHDLFIDQLVDILNVGGPAKRKGWRMQYSLDPHFEYFSFKDGEGKSQKHIDPLKTFQAMEMIGYEALWNYIDNDRAGKDVLRATSGGFADRRNELFKYIYKRYFLKGDEANFNDAEYSKYMKDLMVLGQKNAYDKIAETELLTGDSKTIGEMVQYETSKIFLERFIIREIAARFPSKFLRMDRNRYHHDGVSRWQSLLREMRKTHPDWSADHFNDVMKDMSFAEMLLRQEMSKIVRERIKVEPTITLSQFSDLPYKLDANKIRSLLGQSVAFGPDGKPIAMQIDQTRVNEVVELYETMEKTVLNEGYLNGEAIKDVKEYTYTFGLEDTDISLMTWRGTGPRLTARALKDTGSMETNVVPWIINMPRLLNQIATSGKHDFAPIIEYLQKAQDTITQVHGTGEDFKYAYKIASMVIQYFKKDSMAKPLFGLFRIGKKNSIAAEYAGRSTAVWEWDARDIDRFIVALESVNLIPKEAYDKTVGPKYDDRYITLFGRPIKFGKKMRPDSFHEFTAQRLRKEFGGTYGNMALDIFWQLGPAVLVFLLWKYFQDSLEESSGKKK